MTANRLPLIMFVLIGVVVVVIVGIATGSWVWFGVALAVHFIATATILTAWARVARADRPDRRSDRLAHMAEEATGDRPRTLVNELEGLKHEPPRQVGTRE